VHHQVLKFYTFRKKLIVICHLDKRSYIVRLFYRSAMVYALALVHRRGGPGLLPDQPIWDL
jgi:hypothetical protein